MLYATRVILFMLLFLAFLAGIIWLQIFLSKKQNKWLGLIIPFICFMFSLVAVLSWPMYTFTTISSVTENGTQIIEKTVSQPEKPGILPMFASVLPIFILLNIPTLIFLAIYIACREKLKLRAELDKMNIQDLG